MAIESRIANNSLTEIYVGGGNFITQAAPTYFHQFYKRKILTSMESISDYKEVTEAQKAQIEAQDAAWTEPPQSFIDTWNDACGVWGGYNEATGFFELNGLTDIDYTEAIYIYRMTPFATSYIAGAYFNKRNIRTLIPTDKRVDGIFTRMFQSCSGLRCLITGESGWWFRTGQYMFYECRQLETVDVLYLNEETDSTIVDIFRGCSSLVTAKIKNLNHNLFLGDSPLISFESLQFMISNSKGTTPIIITICPEIYSKITDETNTQWSPLLAIATEKQITFATT